ncbi:MAG: GGDEF domain-containing protein, partial [Polyangiaceae bacterium]|nr:GGDEF domain-containing protein [Polyangiaceae bacterium]
AMLSGISSGHGLGFHRVALFELDEARGAYVGSRAIGPADAEEAHRIWEAIEYDGTGLDGLLSPHARRDADARFEREVRAIALTPGGDTGDEVARALDAAGPLRSAGARLVNGSLAALAPADDFLLAAIRPHGQVRGLLFADDKFGTGGLDDERVALLAGFLEPMALVWENLTLLRRVEQLARHDVLTAVLTRRAFEERLAAEAERAVPGEVPLALLVLDVDHFKHTNDTRGHAAGDAVLRTLGAILRSDLRVEDVPGRLGGDEFAVLLPRTAAADCVRVARRVGAEAYRHGISLSMGIACFPGDCAAPQALVPTADERLYQAKRGGRARVCFAGGVARFD